MKQQIGMVGIGLMGHGLARNIARHGYPLTVMEHPGNRPLDELLAAGVRTAAGPAEVARSADVVILCVTGTPEVEAVLTGAGGVLEGLRPGAVVIDCSTAVPQSTQRMAAAVERAGGRFVDAPMTRTAKHAHEGKLNLLVGGARDTVEEVRPILACFAENITHAGAVGAGHQLKLLHNCVSLGFVALLAEAAACSARAGIAPEVFVETLAIGGGGGAALERVKPYLASGDPSGLQFSVANAFKDMTYYAEMAQGLGAAHAIADGVAATLKGVVEGGHAQAMMPELVGLLGAKAGNLGRTE
ncbi:NAD(P)-dependent oxidoreductase [Chelatococcus reniformis]|uniref:3-hydroxyisobutyrate dehydrogenase n=1 Tax=Chelatococcus reniformis TaxID=1494448 RepID=A0A916TZS7_9HYPH|nr:NAD(P)-dependent oxidoreductase [Chelatococcus reniformis]GGC48984.1 3-hydroxyisobutyrate dehydrogenase [Chelatococcus reniformis]